MLIFLSVLNSCSTILESKSKIFPYTSLKLNANKICSTGQTVTLEPIPLSGEGVRNSSGTSLVLYIESNSHKFFSKNSVPSLSTYRKTQGKNVGSYATLSPRPYRSTNHTISTITRHSVSQT